MSIALLSSVSLSVGEQSAVVTISESDEQVGLRLTSTQVGTAVSQCRLVCLDDEGHVKRTILVTGSGSKEGVVSDVDSDLTVQVECLSGSCQVSVAQLTGTEDLGEGAGAINAADIPDGTLATAKLAAGAVTGPKINLTSLKVLSAVGANGASATLAVTGVAATDRLVAAFSAPTAGGALVAHPIGTDFAAAPTAVNQINQLSVANLSDDTVIFILLPAAA